MLVFEDIHWADEGLLAFVEYLLDWGRHHPIFVLTLARPEVADRHPSFPGTNRSTTTIPLEPLDDESMDALLSGLVPGLPEDVRERLRDAADGIPLYAVETVRMLRDRGVLTVEGGTVPSTGDLDAIEVPDTLHALIASRLDGVPEPERRLLQNASVLGKTFTTRGLSALAGLPVPDVEQLVESLIRKELLTVETDPFSPERGQLGFLQALVQRVTYETIARKDRRRRHLAAARFLAEDGAIDPDEIAEVIASHYLDAPRGRPVRRRRRRGPRPRTRVVHACRRTCRVAGRVARGAQALLRRRPRSSPTTPAERGRPARPCGADGIRRANELGAAHVALPRGARTRSTTRIGDHARAAARAAARARRHPASATDTRSRRSLGSSRLVVTRSGGGARRGRRHGGGGSSRAFARPAATARRRCVHVEHALELAEALEPHRDVLVQALNKQGLLH